MDTASRLPIVQRSVFRERPSRQFWAAVDALRHLAESEGQGVLKAAFAESLHDRGERYGRDHNLKLGRRSQRNVGRLLRGVPARLVDDARAEIPKREPPPWEKASMTKWWARNDRIMARDRAAERRTQIIRRIVAGAGWADHGKLYLRDGVPAEVHGHPYQIHVEDIKELAYICDSWDLGLYISGSSDYYPGWTNRVVLYRREVPKEATFHANGVHA